MLLRKDIYPYEYMDDWKKINKTSLSEKEEFAADFVYARRVYKYFQTKKLSECHDFICLK